VGYDKNVNEFYSFVKISGVPWLAKMVLASQEELLPQELVC
jgi:hypothetical protein